MSGNRSKQTGIERPGKWGDDIPEGFAKKDEKMQSPPKRRMRRAAGISTRQNEHDSLAAATTTHSTYSNERIDLEATMEPISEPSEHNQAKEDNKMSEKQDEDEMIDDPTPEMKGESQKMKDEEASFSDEDYGITRTSVATGEITSDEQYREKEDARMSEDGSVLGEKSPILEDKKASFPVVNHGTTGKSLFEELADASDQSDGEGEYTAATNEDAIPVGFSHSTRSISTGVAMDAASEVGNTIVNSIKAESSHSPEAYIQEILRERDILKKELESRDERMVAMRQEYALLKRELDSRDERIAALEAENAALTSTPVKAIPSTDASTNTETPTGQIWQPNYPREDDNEQQLILIKKPSLPPPVTSPLAQTSTVVRFIQACLDTAKDLYLDFTSVLNLFLSCMRRSAFQDWVRAVMSLATPFWMAMSFSLYLSIQHEKNKWMQANALTRKHLLGHASGTSGGLNLDFFFAIGSMAMYNRYL